MICKHCGKEIDTVVAVSTCYQYATLDGNTIADYGPVEWIEDLQEVECPECSGDLMSEVEVCP